MPVKNPVHFLACGRIVGMLAVSIRARLFCVFAEFAPGALRLVTVNNDISTVISHRK